MPHIIKHVKKGARIHSDEHRTYLCLKHGLKLTTVKHKKFYKALDGTHTNLIESLWNQLKSVNKQRQGTSLKMFPLHIDEWSWRWNKSLDGDIFDLFLEAVGKFYPVK